MKNSVRGIVFLLSALLSAAAIPTMAQQGTGTVSTNAPPAAPPPLDAPQKNSDSRPFFPHNWIRGYVDFSVAPPHNEPDLDRCAPPSTSGGINSNCNAYARYLWSGYLEVQPFGKTFVRRAFFFFEPTFSFGNNTPQFKYTASMAPIAFDRSLGLGIQLPKNFEFRLTQHQVDWLGKYNGNVGPGDLGTPGPYGLYTTVGARWYFGGYGHSHGGE